VKTAVSLAVALALAALALTSGCTPRVMVLVEIANPTDEVLMLSGLDYEVEAHDWFTARGSYALSRYLAPGDLAYLSVPLPVKNFDMALGAPDAALSGVRFQLRGKLRALRGGGEVAWEVHQDGVLEPIVNVRGVHRERHPHQPQIRVRVHVGS
jgi:hypothetical protein